MKRRTFLTQAAAFGAAPLFANTTPVVVPKGKAEHCIFIWLGGGMAQIDTFDPKKLGNNVDKTKIAGSLYKAIDTSVKGVQVTEHLSKTAKVMEYVTAMRTVNHHVIDEHAFATNLVHTGRMISGNVVYPSIGSIIANQRGAADPDVPAYILIGYPNVSRGPGFLGAKSGYVYLTDTNTGPAGFTRPDYVDEKRAEVRHELLKPLMARAAKDSSAADYEMAQQEALRLAGPKFMRHFNLKEEPDALRNEYGGEFGQRCLLARRLVQAGVRFIEVSHNLNFMNGTGWDIHNEGYKNQHLLIQELDTALAALIGDLKAQKILDKTLIVVGTEFGRPPEFDGRGGRGHQGTTFSMVLAGGGLNHCGAYGVTDELAKKPVDNPVPLVDFHATIHAAMGIDPSKELMDGSRPVPITDGGKPVTALFG
ncbi:MAG: DUF1501 domain-containing protein [Verrucomicrobiales bacterium]|nr:DUF1501 domain-containing protein [Verrucomicrobiales bacterium]MCP5560352.1 DUF1501 domain-containing protein [Verrucomicrobiaceae bacterium]